jgi:hypothetical protein
MLVTPSDITAQGNTVAFTATGQTICVKSDRKTKSVKVWLADTNHGFVLPNSTHTFPTKKLAAEYASSIACPIKTEELKWW